MCVCGGGVSEEALETLGVPLERGEPASEQQNRPRFSSEMISHRAVTSPPSSWSGPSPDGHADAGVGLYQSCFHDNVMTSEIDHVGPLVANRCVREGTHL